MTSRRLYEKEKTRMVEYISPKRKKMREMRKKDRVVLNKELHTD